MSNSNGDGMLVVSIDGLLTLPGIPIDVEVYDADFRHLWEWRSDDVLAAEVPPGLYFVSGILSDGSRATRVVEVHPDQTTDVHLGQDEQVEEVRHYRAEPVFRMDSGQVVLNPEPRARESFQIGNPAHTRIEWVSDRRVRVLVTDRSVRGPITVVLNDGTDRFTAALPIGGFGDEPTQTCDIEFGAHGRKEFHILVRPQRVLGRALYGMTRAGNVEDAMLLARHAVDDALSDPLTAVYGALLLNRFDAWRDMWIIPALRNWDLLDMRVLYAAFCSGSDSPAARRRGLAVLLEATHESQVTVFSESMSLALKLLRRWPDDVWSAERRECIELLATTTPYVNYGSTFYLRRHPRDRR